MVSIDKAAIVLTLAIVAIALGVAASGAATQNASPVITTPTMVPTAGPTMEDGAAEALAETLAEAEALAEAKSETHNVEIPAGTSAPGCEPNSCYSPAKITINAGDTVHWMNVDSAAHTVTAGTSADVKIEVFDSSLLMADGTWSHEFNDAGIYDYFCMVHPWMIGTVTVN